MTESLAREITEEAGECGNCVIRDDENHMPTAFVAIKMDDLFAIITRHLATQAAARAERDAKVRDLVIEGRETEALALLEGGDE